jgi:Na+-translocating ferredoxin:NAD+ oxidoreductase subunit G
MMTRLITLFTLLFFSAPAWAGVLMTQEEALKRAFPGASVERKTVFLEEAQVKEIQNLARAKLESEVVTFYVGKSTAGVLGYAFVETHIVRTMPETFMAVLNPDGTVSFVEILAFYEPEDYLPPKRWLGLFGNKKLDNDLMVKRGIRNVTGATLTAQAITDGVRRILAIYQVAIQKERP